MTESEKKQPVAEKEEAVQPPLSPEREIGPESEVGKEGEDLPRSAGELRKASYFVLTIAAVFVINAMETGSYRTPWPVAIVVTVAGLALLTYSLVKSDRENPDA
ncbi:MAG: hypothetical protein RQ753_04505 [Desulfurivibrionaceae bacterium]|nr:hypothetical protein [Desulfobulbales bacterium]MDT8334937.1 hypothetical protein [Desulfurivibrionaceae bacterium]